jgi:ribonuclease BN (tRNA processing enzyme)
MPPAAYEHGDHQEISRMRVTVLGSSGSEGPGCNPPAFLIDDYFLLDAGTVALSLDSAAQCRISHVLLTHAHLDHIKGIPFLADNFVSYNSGCKLVVVSGKEVISDLRKNIFNGRIWPDFSKLPDVARPVLQYQQITTRQPLSLGDYRVHAVRVNHNIPSFGYLVENSAGPSLLYTGDTGPTGLIWKRFGRRKIGALIIEVSFPDEMTGLAIETGHLTPSLLKAEIGKMQVVPDRIFITHLKPFHRERIEEQLAALEIAALEVLRDGLTINL